MQAADKHYAKLGATLDTDHEIEFEADAITLDIPVAGKTIKRTWKIEPLMRPEVVNSAYYYI